jgi:hypothetical protein
MLHAKKGRVPETRAPASARLGSEVDVSGSVRGCVTGRGAGGGGACAIIVDGGGALVLGGTYADGGVAAWASRADETSVVAVVAAGLSARAQAPSVDDDAASVSVVVPEEAAAEAVLENSIALRSMISLARFLASRTRLCGPAFTLSISRTFCASRIVPLS